MPRSSLGFHTMTLSLTLKYHEIPKLISHFKQYSQKTGLIQIYHVDGKGKYTKYKTAGNNTYLPTHLQISYYQEDRGIRWSIRYNNWSSSFKSYIVEVTINPKILGGINDYITAATYDDMETAIKKFNLESERISPLLKSFDDYSIKRVDYCINFALNELAPGCNPELIMNLIKRGNIPAHYKEWKKDDKTAHRMKSSLSSLYLMNPSANINCYIKHVELQERLCKNECKGYSLISQTTINEVQDIIRFEVQCKYHKIYVLSSRAEELGNHGYNKYGSFLSHEACNETINYYFKKIIGRGDWYTLQAAIHIIKTQHFNKQKENRLIRALHFVSQCRSLAKAKESYQNSDLKAFKRALQDLSSLNINPVTIPKEWGTKHIPNLLYTYYDKVQSEIQKKERQKLLFECLDGYIKEYGHLPA